ncbi:unnamed protein product, partial [Amoebophrya sp. A25]|eukprot:GSA25T00001458001.1
MFVKAAHNFTKKVGLAPPVTWLRFFPHYKKDTIFRFDDEEEDIVALTIDDGLCSFGDVPSSADADEREVDREDTRRSEQDADLNAQRRLGERRSEKEDARNTSAEKGVEQGDSAGEKRNEEQDEEATSCSQASSCSCSHPRLNKNYPDEDEHQSMAPDVLNILAKYNARATFFLIT